MMQTRKAFVDTAFYIALFNARDPYHPIAQQLVARMERDGTLRFTTHAVLFEVGNALSKGVPRIFATRFLQSVTQDPLTKVVTVSDSVFEQAVAKFAKYSDKAWGLVDCLSFVVMEEEGITAALTSDQHFAQAGFRALMRE